MLGNGPQLESDQVASWVPGLLLHLPPLPALDLLFVCAAVSIAPLGAAPAFLPMSSARLKNPLSSVLLFSEFLRCYSPVFPRQKLPLALAGHLLLPLHFAHHSYTAYVQGPAAAPCAASSGAESTICNSNSASCCCSSLRFRGFGVAWLSWLALLGSLPLSALFWWPWEREVDKLLYPVPSSPQ